MRQNHVGSRHKQVLFIAHMFPPVGGPGVQRSVKFVKYLPQFGWQPVVLTARYSSRSEKDPKLLEDIPASTKIIRTYSLEECNGPLSPFRYINTPFSIPDRANLWFPWAFSAAIGIIRRNSIKAIYATGSPFSSHILAACLKKFTGLPMIIDYRDEWTLDPDYQARQSRHRQLFLPIERFQQQWVINQANAVLVVTESARKAFVRKYGDLKKLRVLRNGYDAEDWLTAIKPDLPLEKFHFVYTGNTFSLVVKPDTFFQGLALALEQSTSLRNNIEVSFVGEIDEVTKRQIGEMKLEPYIKLKGYMSHPQSIGYLSEADILLLISRAFRSLNLDNSLGKVPGKLYEYIGSEKPVLALTPRESESLHLIERVGAAFWADPENSNEIAKMIVHLEDLWKRDALIIKPDREFTQTLTRKFQTEQLAQILNEISI